MSPIAVVYYSSMGIIALSALLILLRAWRGPTVFDRVVAIESLALAVVGFLLMSAYTDIGRYYTDAALGLALFSFVGAALLARFLGAGDLADE